MLLAAKLSSDAQKKRGEKTACFSTDSARKSKSRQRTSKANTFTLIYMQAAIDSIDAPGQSILCWQSMQLSIFDVFPFPSALISEHIFHPNA